MLTVAPSSDSNPCIADKRQTTNVSLLSVTVVCWPLAHTKKCFYGGSNFIYKPDYPPLLLLICTNLQLLYFWANGIAKSSVSSAWSWVAHRFKIFHQQHVDIAIFIASLKMTKSICDCWHLPFWKSLMILSGHLLKRHREGERFIGHLVDGDHAGYEY